MTARQRFSCRLALALGFIDPEEMLDRMDERTFQHWVAFYKLEPFGPAISNRMLARIAASNAMAPGDEEDFLPKVD